MGNRKIIVSTPKGKIYTYKKKSGDVVVRLSFNKDFGKKYTKLLQDGQWVLDMQVMRLMEPYMQLRTGAMIESMRAATKPGDGEIIVNTPYARKVYYTPSAIGRPTGPLRGPKYFERMKADKKDELRRTAARAAGAK